jgi:hypothetical protein
MYLNARVEGSKHLWRQQWGRRAPQGNPEQISFGATEEEGLAVAPDGKSLVASVGTRSRTMPPSNKLPDLSQDSYDAFAFRLVKRSSVTRAMPLGKEPGLIGRQSELRSSGHVHPVSESFYEVAHQGRNVRPAVPQGWKHDRKYVEPVE